MLGPALAVKAFRTQVCQATKCCSKLLFLELVGSKHDRDIHFMLRNIAGLLWEELQRSSAPTS